MGALRETLRGRTVILTTFVAVAMMTPGLWLWLFPDATRGMTPEAIAAAAGQKVYEHDGYRFAVDLSGESSQSAFPTAVMTGEYRRSPRRLHLEGEVDSRESKLPLEYYLDGSALFLRHPADQIWFVLRDVPGDQLKSFQPDTLARVLSTGVRRAREVRRERLPGGPAVQLALEIDPAASFPMLQGVQQGNVEYRLWVYTRSLLPAQLAINGPPGGEDRFTYRFRWDFQPVSITVPEHVTREARDWRAFGQPADLFRLGAESPEQPSGR